VSQPVPLSPQDPSGGYTLYTFNRPKSGWPQFRKNKIQGLFKDFSRTSISLFKTYYVDLLPSYGVFSDDDL